MTIISKYVYAFDKTNAPIHRAKAGDELTFQTLDCFSGQVCTEADVVGEQFNFSRTNPSSGPVYVEGAKPGDVLVVDVHSESVGFDRVRAAVHGSYCAAQYFWLREP